MTTFLFTQHQLIRQYHDHELDGGAVPLAFPVEQQWHLDLFPPEQPYWVDLHFVHLFVADEYFAVVVVNYLALQNHLDREI